MWSIVAAVGTILAVGAMTGSKKKDKHKSHADKKRPLTEAEKREIETQVTVIQPIINDHLDR